MSPVSHYIIVPLFPGGGQEAATGIVSTPHHLRAIRHIDGSREIGELPKGVAVSLGGGGVC